MQTVTFKLDPSIVKKLKREPEQNRLFNNHSEILRMLVTTYLLDPTVKACVDAGIKRRYPDLLEREQI